MLAEGVHGKIVQERLGHSNIAMTLDLYSHVTADMQKEAAERLEVLLDAAS
jgi:integrase